VSFKKLSAMSAITDVGDLLLRVLYYAAIIKLDADLEEPKASFAAASSFRGRN
jgi:hypothetical protein